jgi:hypothetical protein
MIRLEKIMNTPMRKFVVCVALTAGSALAPSLGWAALCIRSDGIVVSRAACRLGEKPVNVGQPAPVVARYTMAPGTTIRLAPRVSQVIDYSLRLYDKPAPGSVTRANAAIPWRFVAPSKGIYAVTASVGITNVNGTAFPATNDQGQPVTLNVYVVAGSKLVANADDAVSGQAGFPVSTVHTEVSLNAGDLLYIQAEHNFQNTAYVADDELHNYVVITKVSSN